MFFTDKKLEARSAELKEFRYRDIIHIEEFSAEEDTQGAVNPILPDNFSQWGNVKIGENWTGRDKYLWLHKELSIPDSWKGKKAVGIFDFGATGAGNNSGFESMLYLNGKPYQGVDSNHKEVFLQEDMIGKTIDATFRLWSGLEGGGTPTPLEHKLSRGDLAWLDEGTDDLYYMSAMIIETIKNLEDTNPIKNLLRSALDRGFKLIDWSNPGSGEFYQSVYRGDKLLNEEIDKMDKNSLVTIKCIGHTHIDVAWLWRLKHTREKCSRSFSTVLRLMEQYPEYIFLQTQPQLYEYIKNDFPEIYEGIKARITEGRWEVDGGMWVEADCNLTCGESLTRQLLIGSRFIKEEFGKDVKYLWLPDVFGYSWALPQILKKSGIDMFMTSKISWNQYNRMPHDTFQWIGIDGSKVLTHFITTPEPYKESSSWFYTYNGQLLPNTVKGTWDEYSEKDINQELLIPYGFGDGGGGVNRDNLEQRRRIDKIPGMPNLKTGTATDYFRDLKETIKNTDGHVAEWDGELYLEYHRGTYTSHAYNKMMNRKMELFYRESEWLTAMAAVENEDILLAEQEELTKGWKILLTNQFHDIIPGSSILEVYEDSKVDYNKAEEIGKQVGSKALKQLMQQEGNAYTLINNSGWLRDETVTVPVNVDGCFKDGRGNLLKSWKTEEGYEVLAENVPPMSLISIYFETGEKAEAVKAFRLSATEAETPFYLIKFNQYGQISSLYDKENDREILPEGERANVLQMFEDKPLGNEAWDIEIFYQEKMREITDLQCIEVKEEGSLKAVLHMEWNYMNSKIKQDLILYAYDRRIDFKTWVDYKEKRQLMKAAFPVDIRSTYATYDVQYGNVRRPNHWNTSWDQARFESVAQKWVDLSEHNYGVSLLNDCKYGHDIKGNVIRITLLKAALHPDYLQDQGEHEFTYSLLPHSGDFVAAGTVKAAFALNQPLKVLEGKCKNEGRSFLTADNEAIEIDAIKQSEDKKYLVVRLHEYTGSTQKVNLKAGFKIKGWMESDLMERPVENLTDTSDIHMKLKPYEIKTILIKL